jgi:putative phosphoesterase
LSDDVFSDLGPNRGTNKSMSIALISDTHGLLRPEVVERLAGAQRILHMGDVGDPEILAQLKEIAPLTAIRGNVDHGEWATRLPETIEVEVHGKRAYLIHNLAQLDLDPSVAGIDLVLYGHTHRPDQHEEAGVHYVNPGSIGPRRFDLPVSMAWLEPGPSIRFETVV